jgi:GNAT superfamily N-acetyltransferase
MPGEFEARRGVDGLGDFHHFGRRRHAAAPGAAVDLHEALDLGAVLLRSRRQVGHIFHVVDAADGARAELGHARQTVDLGRVADLVGHQHVLDAAAGEDLGLGNLLAADAAGAAQFDLQLGHVDGLVHLAVHPVAHAMGLGVVAHLLDVALQRVEVEDEAGRLDVAFVHAGKGGDVVAHFEALERGHVIHFGLLLIGGDRRDASRPTGQS